VLRGEMPRAETAAVTASIERGCRWLACRRKRLDRLFASSCAPRAGMPLRRVMLDRHARRLADGPRVRSLAAVLGSANRRRPGQVPRSGSLAFASNRRRLLSVCAEDRQSRWRGKTPDYADYLRLLSTLFRGARSVHMIGDGRDVALSTIDLKPFRRASSGVMGLRFRWLGPSRTRTCPLCRIFLLAVARGGGCSPS
jgi:hypothetical protein